MYGIGMGIDPMLYQQSQPQVYQQKSSAMGPFLLGAGTYAGVRKLHATGRLAPLYTRAAGSIIGKNVLNFKAIYQAGGARALGSTLSVTAAHAGKSLLTKAKALPGPLKWAGLAIGAFMLLKGGKKQPPPPQFPPFMSGNFY